MDEQGLDAVVLFPTLGCGVEQALRFDVPATMASLTAFNRWLEDDWGYSYRDRIIAAPMISLADPDAAIAEIDRVLERGARIVHVRPAPGARPAARRAARSATTRTTRCGPGSPRPTCRSRSTWATAATTPCSAPRGAAPRSSRRSGKPDPLGSVIIGDRAIHDTMASLDRARRVQAPPDAARREHRERLRLGLPAAEGAEEAGEPHAVGVRRSDPLDTMRSHVWVTPYYEDDLRDLADTIGVERMLFGSDWPHGEGLADPAAYPTELADDHGFDQREIDLVMRANSAALLGLPVHSPA